jgi:hypothetical protein
MEMPQLQSLPRVPLGGAMRLSDGKAVGNASAAGLGPSTWENSGNFAWLNQVN